jgi:hypothetical protein
MEPEEELCPGGRADGKIAIEPQDSRRMLRSMTGVLGHPENLQVLPASSLV